MNSLSAHSVLGSAFVFFEEQFLEALNAQQKKVALVAIAIFSLVTVSTLAYYFYFQAKKIGSGDESPEEKNKIDESKVDQVKKDQKKVDQIKNDKKKVDQGEVDQKKAKDKVDSPKISDAEVEKVKRLVEKNGLALVDYPNYHDNEEVVELSVKDHPYAIQYASERLQGNAKLMRLPIEGNGYTAQYAAKKLRDENRDLAKLAVSGVNGDGMALEFFPAFQDDEEIVELAYKQNKNALDFASHRLQSKFQENEAGDRRI